MSTHIIIMAVTLKLVEFPQASMQIPIGQNRKRGRHNKTKKALVRQKEIIHYHHVHLKQIQVLQNLIIHHF